MASEQGEAFDDKVRQAARAYHTPPAPPRREMWFRIQQARASRQPRRSYRPRFRLLAWTAGLAAALLVGVGLGRLSVERRPASVAVTPAPAAAPRRVSPRRTPPPPVAERVYRVPVVEHLEQAEVFLTLFRLSVRRETHDPLASATARQLLATNRLLLDSPAATNPTTRTLLEDLELVLARIAQLSPQAPTEDLRLITTGMERADVMARLRSEVPAGSGVFRRRSS